MIAAEAPALPIALNAGAADYGLLYVYPLQGRMALIQSGIPWYTGGGGVAGQAHVSAGAISVPAGTWRLSCCTARASIEFWWKGRFDSQWRLKPADREALRATGVVVVKPVVQSASAFYTMTPEEFRKTRT